MKMKTQSSDFCAIITTAMRARAGMVICGPAGNPHKNPSGFWEDSTRMPEFYDEAYQYLKSLGIQVIP